MCLKWLNVNWHLTRQKKYGNVRCNIQILEYASLKLDVNGKISQYWKPQGNRMRNLEIHCREEENL